MADFALERSERVRYNPAVKRISLLAVAAAVLATSAAVSSASTTRIVGFRTPSKNIACMYERAEFGHKAFLRCDLLSGLKPQPHKSCELDWTGLGMSKRGKAGPICAGDTVYDKREPILKYGHTWKHRGFACHSKRTGLKCSNRGGHGFFLSRQSWRVH